VHFVVWNGALIQLVQNANDKWFSALYRTVSDCSLPRRQPDVHTILNNLYQNNHY